MEPIAFKTEDDSNMLTQSRGLKLIGIRFYPYVGNNNKDKRKAKCIQKSLYGSSDWFYFNNGFKIIEGNDSTVEKVTVEKNAFDSDKFLYSNETLNVSVSAIVGQNGTGKSTVVDTVIRLINNLSAAIIGENFVYSTAQHLHYIDNVFASLAIYKDAEVQILICMGRKLTMTVFNTDVEKLYCQYRAHNGPIVEEYFPNNPIQILSENGDEDISQPLPSQEKYRNLLQDWFYTLVSNYSLYAYNYRDYVHEESNNDKIKKILDSNSMMSELEEEDKYWLKGVFHKNDGYQAPIVIHPMREDGYINASRVNLLGKQNLVSLAFEKIGEKFPFREINKTHHIVGFYFPKDKYYEHSFRKQLQYWIGVDEETAAVLSDLERPIKQFWRDVLSKLKVKGSNEAWDYLAYKTIKVLWTYKHYEKAWKHKEKGNVVFNSQYDLTQLLSDGSHRTLKIRQTVAYLRFHRDKDYYLKKRRNADCNDIWKWMEKKIGKEEIYPGHYMMISKEDLLPPPFVDVALLLVDDEHFISNNRYTELDIIPFEGLSSGERQIAYSIGNILYHLKNLGSMAQGISPNSDNADTIQYKYVNIMLDEVEQYFHPDLQRRFLNLLVDSIHGLKMKGCKGINITLITHSPFVLSDIPDSNILYMSRNKDEIKRHSTFAANVHDLFNDAFFLPNTMGEIAKCKVEEVVSRYYDLSLRENKNWDYSNQNPDSETETNMLKMQYISRIVGDNYLHDELTDMVEEMYAWKKRQNQSCDEED